jgi:hypothetical protein
MNARALYHKVPAAKKQSRASADAVSNAKKKACRHVAAGIQAAVVT